jgi:2-keto-4-pentenoate hydratase
MMDSDLIDPSYTVANAFVSARREALPLAAYPGTRPIDLDEAYRIQTTAIHLDGRPIIGWKVGKINPPLDARLGSNRLAGPVFANTVIFAEPATSPAMPVFEGGFAAAEAEMMLRLAPGWNGEVPADDVGTKAILDSVRLGIEIASSPYAGINEDGPPITISDFGNNAGLVLGPELKGWRDVDLCSIPIRTEIDGAIVGAGTAATMLDGPYGAVRFLLANLKHRGLAVSDGLWISTGAVTGVHSVKVGQHVRAIFGDHATVTCKITAASRG